MIPFILKIIWIMFSPESGCAEHRPVFTTGLYLRKDHHRPIPKHLKSQIPHDFSSVHMKAEVRLMMLKAALCPWGLLCVTQENELPGP